MERILLPRLHCFFYHSFSSLRLPQLLPRPRTSRSCWIGSFRARMRRSCPQDKGYYKAEGVTVDTIDAGRGATNVAVAVAGGAYQFGWVDMPSLVRFNAQNPAAPLVAVYVSFDETPL